MSVERWIRVQYVDGTSETFSFPKQVEDDYERLQKIRETMQADRLVLEVEGMVHIIPLSAVKHIDFSPAPTKLPDFVIRGASMR